MPDSVYNPFTDAEEILFKDADGQMKVWKAGAVEHWNTPVGTLQPLPTASSGRAVPSEEQVLDVAVDRVLTELRLTFSNDLMSRRLRTLVRSRFKDIRDAIETKEGLQRPTKVGGLGLVAEAADAAARVIEAEYRQYVEKHRRKQDQTVQSIEANVGEVQPSLSAVPPAWKPALVPRAPARPSQAPVRLQPVSGPMRLIPLPAMTAPTVTPLPPVARPAASTPVVPPPVPVVPAPKLAPSAPLPLVMPAAQLVSVPPQPTEVAPPPLEIPSVPLPQLPPLPASVAPIVPSVRVRPKLVGPLEEISELTVVDFRRLDADPAKATQRLREKIVLLEQQSFAHKVAAIAAWRKSEVFRRYTELASVAMVEKKPMVEVIAARKASEADVFTVEEFEAIADFNRTLRF